MSSSDRRMSFRSDGAQRLSRTTINSLPDELLVEIFDWCRQDDGYGWNYRRRWYNPLQVCRRWRYSMLEWSSRLELRFLCNFANSISTIPSHFPPMPLILSFKFNLMVSPHSSQELLFALQHHDRVRAISITSWSLGYLDLCTVLDNAFPMLEIFSLVDDQMQRMLPNNFVAPRLRALHLRHIIISNKSLLLTNVTSLLSLRLESMRHFAPDYLVERIANMPHLENISLSFLSYSPLPDSAKELLHPQITPVVLPKLLRLIYSGTSTYLDNILPRISTPFLQDFRFTFPSTETSPVHRLSAFFGTIQNLNLRTAVVSFFPRSVTVAYHPEQPSVAPTYIRFAIDDTSNHERAVSPIARICSAIASAIPIVESLEIELKSPYDSYHRNSGDFLQRAMWHTFLRSFGGVKTLRVDMDLAVELSDVLHPKDGSAIEELFPSLSELIVVSGEHVVHQPFYSFIRTRRLSGHPIDLRVIRDSRPLRPPPISWSFDTFGQ